MDKYEEIFLAGGCLWGVQEFLRYVPGVETTEAGRANGSSQTTSGAYDGYAECVRTLFNPQISSVENLMSCFFEIVDPYSLNRQGDDIGTKYRTGVYSLNPRHLEQASAFIQSRPDRDRIVVEVLALSNFVSSDTEHQDRLFRCPDDYCHIEPELLHKYKQ